VAISIRTPLIRMGGLFGPYEQCYNLSTKGGVT
jgi:hypothetical protein